MQTDRQARSNETAREAANWSQFRRCMPITKRWAYFDNAAVSPISGPAYEAVLRWGQQAAELGDTAWPIWSREAEEVRRLAAQLLNAAESEIALVASTTAGINMVAEGFPWRPGDNVVILNNEFPTNCYPWMNLKPLGVETRLVAAEDGRVDLDALGRACDQNTRIVSLSWVGYASGYRLDVQAAADMCHAQGALFFLDAIQGLGVFPLNVRDAKVDFLAADGHKWLLGPEGAGVMYIRHEHLDFLRPTNVGWNSVKHRNDFSRLEYDVRDDASRYEGGSLNMAGFLGLAASMRMLLDFGAGPRFSTIADRVIEVTDLCCDRLEACGADVISQRGPECSSGIVVFEIPGVSPDVVRKECMARDIVISNRNGRLRASAHAYNDEEDVERLVSAIQDLAQAR